MLRLLLSFCIFTQGGVAAAHNVQVGSEIARGACARVQSSEKTALQLFGNSSDGVRYSDGVVDVIAVVVPDKSLPQQKPDDVMTSCARKVFQDLRTKPQRPTESIPEEEQFNDRVNRCLAESGATYRSSFVILKRDDVICPTECRPQAQSSSSSVSCTVELTAASRRITVEYEVTPRGPDSKAWVWLKVKRQGEADGRKVESGLQSGVSASVSLSVEAPGTYTLEAAGGNSRADSKSIRVLVYNKPAQ